MNNKRLNHGYIASFCMELYLIMQAGIALDDGMEMLRYGESDAEINRILTDIVGTLREGNSLHIALSKSEAFPKYMTDMISVGEETGNLDRSLKALSKYYNRQEALAQSVRRAVLYPAVLMTMLTAVVLVLIVEVLPMFSDVYAQLGGTMTGLGAGILQFGIILKENWIVAIIAVVAVIAIFVAVSIRGQKTGQRVLMSKRLGTELATSKLASILSMALHSGLDMDMTMEMAQSLIEHPEISAKITKCRENMQNGESFADSVSQSTLFPSLYCRMFSVGMRTGAMDEVMEDIAERCDANAENSIERYIGSVEPTLVVIMSIFVGAILLSVMLPLASIMSSLG